jgi:hypothetical protein
MKIKLSFIFVACLLFVCLTAQAEVQYRGFQVGYSSMHESDFDDLAKDHNTNLIRFQITHADMDSITEQSGEAAYQSMVGGVLDEIDPKMNAAIMAGNKIVIGFALPPGGFKDRNASPPHSKMFSSPELQGWYIRMVVTLIERYRDNIDAGDIYAVVINSEPADSPSEPGNGAEDWNELLIRTVNEIRKVHQTATLMVMPLWGDPTRLTNLPIFDDDNIIYGYHWYLWNSYQHTGEGNSPFSVKRPGKKQISNRTRRLLGKFFLKWKNANRKGEVSFYPPRLGIGEFAISACASNSATFLDDLLYTIEGEDAAQIKNKNDCSRFKKKKRRKKCRQQQKNKPKKTKKQQRQEEARLEVAHESWTFHAWREARIWDPKQSCDQNGNFTYAGQTDRMSVLDKYLQRNFD